MNIRDKFEQLRKEKKKAFIPYITFGFPNIKYTKDIILTLQDSGADIIELGLPFSDPLADGPIIQRASDTALKSGATIEKLFSMFELLKDEISVPVVIMTYYNPIFRFGVRKFFRSLKEVGVNGIMVVDLPIEESGDYCSQAEKFDLETVFFVTPATTISRAKRIVKPCKGFVYYISVTGITGPRKLLYKDLISHVRMLKGITSMPICVGFGIHTSKQVKEISAFSDGVIVGSSFIKFIEENYLRKDFIPRLKRFTKMLCSR